MITIRLVIFGSIFCLAAAPPATRPAPSPASHSTPADDTDGSDRPRPEYGLLTPIPESGGLPKIYGKLYDLTAQEIRHRAKVRQYEKQIRIIRHKNLGEIKVEKIRKAGLDQLAEFTDPASFQALIQELALERDDVRLWLLDHFVKCGDEGQAALGWIAVHDHDAAIRNEATRRMVSPVGEPVRYIIDNALRSDDHSVVSSAASLASSLNVTSAIPLLIFAQAQVTSTEAQDQGDLAWIAIQTQRAYVQNLVPVVGSGSGAFQPVMGIVSEGVVMRVMDAVVISYRTVVHESLVNLTTSDWGQETEPMGYNIRSWWDWYNTQYIPYKRHQLETAQAEAAAP